MDYGLGLIVVSDKTVMVNSSYTMFAKSKLIASPTSKASSFTQKPQSRAHTLQPKRFFSHQHSQQGPDPTATREKMDYRHRNHTQNIHNRHSAVTIHPRSKSGTSHLRPHTLSIPHALRKIGEGKGEREQKLLMVRQERLSKIRQGFGLKNRMGGDRKVPTGVSENAKLNSFTELARKVGKQGRQKIAITNIDEQNVPKFFDFCESNQHREQKVTEPKPQTKQLASSTQGILPQPLNQSSKVCSMKKIALTPPLMPITIETASPFASIQTLTGSYRPFLDVLIKAPREHFAIIRIPKGVYFGELKDGRMEGKGIVFYHNGKVFQGHFVGGVREGLGFEKYPDGSSYLGDFSGGKREGRGRFEWSSGEVYEGEWQGGRKEGSGLWKGLEGVSYVGQWHGDAIDGFGVLSQPVSRYEGEFRSFAKSGNGTLRFDSGETYTGSFRQNLPNGQGDYYWPNGDHYHGEFVNGKRHGIGVLRLASGGCFRGEFKNDKRSGEGEENYPEGTRYEGGFQNDLKHGWGRLSDGDGRVLFEGYWVNNDAVQGKRAQGFEAIKQEESFFQKDPSIIIRKNQSSSSMMRQKFAMRKLGGRKSLSKDRSMQSIQQVKPFRRACNCERHRGLNTSNSP